MSDRGPTVEAAVKLVQAAVRPGAEAPEACGDVDWGMLAPALELHGLLGLVCARLEGWGRGDELPQGVRERLDALRSDAARDVTTTRVTLEALEEHHVPVILLKGAALRDLYPDPAWRGQGDVDVFVPPNRSAGALKALGRAGLVMSPAQLPLWFHRLVHFHVKLHPAAALLKEVEVHWRLQSPALLVGPPVATIWGRSQTSRDLHPARVLDPLDRWLHLATHLLSHWRGQSLGDGRDLPASLLAQSTPPVRLKWLADLALASENLEEDAAALGSRAREWGAVRSLVAVARALAGAELLGPRGEALLQGAAATLGAGERGPAGAPGRGAGRAPHAAVGFRLQALDRIPRWMFPGLAALRRRYARGEGRGATAIALLAAPAHAGWVALRVLIAALALPPALAARFLLATRRRRSREAALQPDRILTLAATWRRELAGLQALREQETHGDPRAEAGRGSC